MMMMTMVMMKMMTMIMIMINDDDDDQWWYRLSKIMIMKTRYETVHQLRITVRCSFPVSGNSKRQRREELRWFQSGKCSWCLEWLFPGFHIFLGFHSFDIVLIVFSCFFQGIPFPLGVWNGLKDLAKQLEVEQELPSVIWNLPSLFLYCSPSSYTNIVLNLPSLRHYCPLSSQGI